MKYRRFGNTGSDVSALGFGCMRLPTLKADDQVDVALAVDMIRTAIDQGVNYIDTAYVYHGGESERVIARALQDGYRGKVRIADKMPVWEVKTAADLDRIFEEQLHRLEVDHIDCYLLHNLHGRSWPRMRDLGVLDWLDGIKRDGRVSEVGFSFHDDYDTFTGIIDAYAGWSFCQIQYNYMNETVQAGTKGLEYAAARGLGVVVMEPLLGGCLARLPPAVEAVWDAAERKRTAADRALQWVWNHPEVSVVLSGMSTLEQVRQNLESARTSGAGSLDDADLGLIDRARQKCYEINPVGCTGCGYCMPCPSGVNIPVNMQLYSDAVTFKGSQQQLNSNLYKILPETARAVACTACRECEEKCPQGIDISGWMPRIHANFASG